METSDKCCSSGVGIGTCLTSLSMTWTPGSSAPSASLPLTPSCVVLLPVWREGMPSRGVWRGFRWICEVQQCQVHGSYMGQCNPSTKTGKRRIESNPDKSDLGGVLVDKKLNMSWQCKSQLCAGLHQKQCRQQGEGGDFPPLLHASETPPGGSQQASSFPLPGSFHNTGCCLSNCEC